MTRLYFEPIAVECDDGHPRRFVWRAKPHAIQAILKRWIVRVDWWRQEVCRQYYQVECEELGTYEIYRDERDRWFLERLYD
jgi:hypothetical protein